MYLPLLEGVLCLSFVCHALLCVHFSFAVILKKKTMLVALLLLSYRCIVTINVLWLLLTMPWVGRQCVIVVLPDHTHLIFATIMLLPFFVSFGLFFGYAVLSVMYIFEEERDELLYFNRLLDVLCPLVFYIFASRCGGYVYSV